MSDAPSAIPLVLPQLDEIMAKLDAVLAGRLPQAWYTLDQCWRLKFAAHAGKEGAIALGTIKNDPALQPRGGIPDDTQSNRKVWSAATVEEWLLVADAGLAAYLARVNPRRKVPDRIRDALAKRGVA